jgi:hydrogenase maturation factor
MNEFLPIGKLPPDLLGKILSNAPVLDRSVLLGPSVGMDCAVVDNGGENLLVLKSDPITFATDEIGWYAVQISANDIATTGATPRWYLATALLPEAQTTPELIEKISGQIFSACREMGISVVGGHTEITYGLDRPIVMGTLVGEVAREKLVTPRGARLGDLLFLTKGVPVEATSILAREFPDILRNHLSASKIEEAAAFLHNPGISITEDARIALASGRVTAMHDPTEGGLAAALWELAEASGRSLVVDLEAVHIPELSARICEIFDLDPLATIASGALLFSAESAEAGNILQAFKQAGILCNVIGEVEEGPAGAWKKSGTGREILFRPFRDEITKVYEKRAA